MELRYLGIFALLLAIGSGSAADTPDRELFDLAEIAAELEQKLSAAGFIIEDGEWRTWSVAKCVEEQSQCYGNNPTTPYGYIDLNNPPGIPGPDQPDHWKLRGDEAVVIFGFTPPPLRYFAYTHYLFSRDNQEPERTVIAASLGNSLNMLRLQTSGSLRKGENTADRFTAIIATPDVNAYREIRGMLASIPPIKSWMVNYLPMVTQSGLRYGHRDSADDFSVLLRAAIPDDSDALQDYLADIPMKVMRVTPADPRTPRLFPAPPTRSPETGIHELDVDPTLELRLGKLVEAISERYGRDSHVVELQLRRGDNITGHRCIVSGSFCVFNNQDAVYTWDTPPIYYLSEDPNDFVIVAGVDHRKLPFAKDTYTNHSVYKGGLLRIGVLSAADDLFEGSAEYHKGTADVDVTNLYAYKIALDCAGEPYCLDLPTIAEDPIFGIDLDEPVYIVGRFYLHPTTKFFPSADEVVFHRVLSFRPLR